MYLRLAFAVAAHLDADILVVDEVLAVGDAEFQRKCLGRMAAVEREGRTVVFVSHDLDAIVRLCPDLRSGSTAAAIVADRPDGRGGRRATWRRACSGVEERNVRRRARPARLPALRGGGEPRRRRRRRCSAGTSRSHRGRPRVQGTGARAQVAVSVQSLRGLRVLDEASADGDEPLRRRPVTHGPVSIPPILNAGDYEVGVWLGTDFEEFAWVDDAVSLHLEGSTGGRPDRVLQLGLAWEVAPALSRSH